MPTHYLVSFLQPLLRTAVLLALGAVNTLAFAPYPCWWLPPLSLTGLLLALRRRSPRQGAIDGFAYGFGLFAAGLNWVHVSIDQFGGMPFAVTLALMALLCAYLALYPALVCYLLNRSVKQDSTGRIWLAFPALWLLGDWLRGWLLTGFPWLWLGYSQSDSPLAGWAPLLGVEGATLGVLLSACALYWLLSRRRLILPLAVLALCWGGGAALQQRSWGEASGQMKVALVQGNIEQTLKWDPQQRWPTLLKYLDLSRPHMDADLIVWPESAIPAMEFEVSDFLQRTDDALRWQHTALVTGIIDYQRSDGRYYNALIGLGQSGTDNSERGSYLYGHENRYFKHQLLPIGEFVPFEQWLRPLAPLFHLPMSSFSRGSWQQTNLYAKGHKIVPAICYEIAFNEQLRANLQADSELLLTVSNDAWFGDSIGPHQHLQIARWRALELARPVLRATNTGITAIIDAGGHIQGRLPQFEDGVLADTVTLRQGLTPYARWGSWPLYLWIGAALLLALRQTRSRELKDQTARA